MSTDDDVKKFTDGFANFVAGMGQGVNNLTSAGTYVFDNLTQNRIKLEAMYRGSWMAGAIVDRVADDMTREGIDIESDIDPKKMQEMQRALTTMGIWKSLQKLFKWGRLYGGAIAVIEIDGQDYSEPLRLDRIQRDSFLGLTVYDRWQLQVSQENLILKGAQAGLPKFYTIVSNIYNGSIGGKPIHHSRVIRATGIELPAYQAIQEQLWGESVLERIYDRIVSFDDVTASATNLIQKAYLRTVKIDGLREVLAAGGQAQSNLLKQFDMMRYLQRVEGLSLIDKNDELETAAYSFSGLSDMMLQFAQQLSGGSKIPSVVLFGETPAGLNASGSNELRIYYDGISAEQESYRAEIMKILLVMHSSMFGQVAAESFNFDFVPLWQTSAREKTEIGDITTRQVMASYEAGVIDLTTALKELKQSSEITGIYTNITDEQISESEFAPPPTPEFSTQSVAEEEKVAETETVKDDDKVRLSLFQNLKNWVTGRD
jgi:hypothetical protein